MYINKIDDLIDKIIDDFNSNVISTNKTFINKILKEINFVKYQKEINDIMDDYIKTVNLMQIRELVKNEDSIYSIQETIKRYIALYLFLTIGYYYASKHDTFINNIVEFSKNQSAYQYKIENFFNAESNATVIKYYYLIRNIVVLLEADSQKRDILKVRPEYKDAINFLNDLGGEFISSALTLESVDGNRADQAHNLIKTIILRFIYKIYEKKEFFRLLETAETMHGEYMFIDIVVPTTETIDFSTIENILSKKDVMQGLAYEFWDYLLENEERLKKAEMSHDEKILGLINAGILIPIVDDFLLYHKDSEKYDKAVDPSKLKKKEDTKIRFIINKIDTASELNSEAIKRDEKLLNNVKKQFYVPLYNRKAVLINDYEDIKIINKFINQGKRSVENNEYFNDLIHYRSYPYVNFKEFKKDGFGITLNKTVDMVRGVSFETGGDFRQNPKSKLQLRIGSKEMVVNVVGFIIPTNLRPMQCLKIADTTNIKQLSKKNQNAYELILQYLDKSSIQDIDHKSSVLWMFDLETDKVTTQKYDQTTKFTKQDQIKNVVSRVYEGIMDEIFNVIITQLNENEKQGITLQLANHIIRRTEKRTLRITNDILRNELDKKLYNELIVKFEPEYDLNEDVIHGISGDIIKLPNIPPPKQGKIKTIKMNLSELTETGEREEVEILDAVCQHNISWEKLSEIKKIDQKQYMDEMYAFIQQYVTENVEGAYICKSCSYYLNIKKYIMDGVFDDDTQRFITYSMPMEVPLEDIPEYEKFKISIRNIDKLIEKIAMLVNIPYFMGSSTTARWRRKAIVKDVVDVVQINNSKLKRIFKERNESATKLYNVSRDLSNLFVFDLDNSIFIFSSKDKDYYKPIKQNNILSYIIILMMLELNESQITYITGDKKGFCNFQIFDKVYTSLFEGLKFRKNNKAETISVKDHKIFCYVLYIISCMVTKYNMWYYEFKDPSQKKKYLPTIQKIIIHTVIDVLNSILENGENATGHTYEILLSKFHNKTTFINEDLYQRFKNEGKTSIVGEKKEFIITETDTIKLPGKYTPITYDIPIWRQCKPFMLLLPNRTYNDIVYNELNNITNCPDGKFHDWKPAKDTYICTLCSKSMTDLKYDENESKNIRKNFRYIRLQELASKYCISDGSLHQFVINKDGKNVCIKCGKEDTYQYTHEELDTVEKVVMNYKETKIDNDMERKQQIQTETKEELTYNEKVMNQIIERYGKTATKDDGFNFINSLITEIQSVMGNDTGTNVYLKDNTYIIDHDHLGYPLEKPIIITDKDNKITYKTNHPFFKTDVIYYTSYKMGKIDVFYDATNKMMLGYKEESKNFISDRKPEKRIKVNYSIYNKIKYLGYVSKFIDVNEFYADLYKERNKKTKEMRDEYDKIIVKEIIRDRIENLKKIMYKFQRLLVRIINGYTPPSHNNIKHIDDESDFFSEKLDSLVEKYKKKLISIKLTDSNNEHPIFKHWKGVSRVFFPEDVKDLLIDLTDTKLVSADFINRYDKSGNMILFYIIDEITRLLKYNTNKFTKASISSFIIDFISTVFDSYNEEDNATNQDIKRFNYIINSVGYLQEIQDKLAPSVTEGIYEEHKDTEQEEDDEEKERQEDAREEAEALDMDTDMDYMSKFDQDYDMVMDERLQEGFTASYANAYEYSLAGRD